jgi:hypothetical protein
MKLINAVVTIAKFILSIAGVVLIINRIAGILNHDQYKYDVDSLLNKEEKNVKPRPKSAREFNLRYFQNAVYESMDF